MPKSHEGRVAIVTGAANGIGRAIALELGARGAQLVLVDLEEAADAAAQLGGRTLVLRADVSQDADWQRVAREVDSHFGRCDIVVNNAAYMKGGTIDELDYETWRRALAVNLDAHFLELDRYLRAGSESLHGFKDGYHRLHARTGERCRRRWNYCECHPAGAHQHTRDSGSSGRLQTEHLAAAGHQAFRRAGRHQSPGCVLDQR